MKKIVAILGLFFVLSSCSVNEDANFRLTLLPIESVEVPDQFQLGQTYEITYRYYKPTSCYASDGVHYDSYLNERTFAVRNLYRERSSCVPTDQVLVEETFQFYVTSNGSYIFKFWNGINDNGEYVFLEYEIPVVN